MIADDQRLIPECVLTPRRETLRVSRCACVGLVCGALSVTGCRDAAPTADIPEAAGSATASVPELRLIAPSPDEVGPSPPRFEDVAGLLGIHFERYDDQQGLNRIMEGNGGGAALFDFDRDGRLDVFFTNGCRLPRTSADRSHPSPLYRQDAAGRFRQVQAAARLLPFGFAQGCAVGDFDEDGFEDVFVTAFGRCSLWRNAGDGTFDDVTTAAGALVDRWCSSAAFADFNQDGALDLYIAAYLDTGDDPPRLCPQPDAPGGYIMCPPAAFSAADDVLLLSDGKGGFRDATVDSGVIGKDGKGLGVVTCDFDLDGDVDVYVANDGTPNFLYLNALRDGSPGTAPAHDAAPSPLSFAERGLDWGAALSGAGFAQAGMGIACGDYDRDGWPDLLVTNFFDETNTLYRNRDGAGFADVTGPADLALLSKATLGFGTEFIDYDNDGWLDLFIANGHIEDRSWRTLGGQPYRMPPHLFRNTGIGRFVDVAPLAGDYFHNRWIGRGVAAGDIDNDGDVDLAVSHQRAPAALLRNDTASPPLAIVLRLIGSSANRSAIGAVVEAIGLGKPLVRDVLGGGSYQSASGRRVHVGLGAEEAAPQLRVRWPSGAVEEWTDVRSGHYLVREGGRLLIPLDAPR